MVFLKNAQLGKVKTRLALTVGDVRALQVYELLLRHTLAVTKEVPCDRVVYYSDFIPGADEWQSAGFHQAVQSGGDLGERMRNAFAKGFSQNYSAIVIVGSDCYEMGQEHLRTAFAALRDKSVVIGPAHDGGYYLLGMTKLHERLFREKAWSSDSVCADTIRDINFLGLTFQQLETLHDIDNEEDLKRSSIGLL